tara:strand:+ start:131 stop:1861 length:1731 start_codon:yes stop_codon:yes gene_type:complete
MLSRLLILQISLLMAGHPITIDGQFHDWDEVPIIFQDLQGDGDDADFSIVKITYDNEFLFFYFNFFDGEHLMQDWNDFKIYIDSDNDITTGLTFEGIGAELEWTFGQRSGTQYINSEEIEVGQNDLTLRIGPTVTSTEFEIAIARDSDILTINGSNTVINGKVILLDNNGDMVPNESGGISFSIGEDYIQEPNPISLDRTDISDIRIISYNTLSEGMIDPEREPYFRRLMQALEPDIIAIQEHFDWNEIDDIVQSWFPQEQWYASWTYRDLVVLSRFPILNDANMISSERTMVALLDTYSELGVPLLLFNSHLSCCSNNESRQQQVDEFTSAWRDWVLTGDGPFDLDPETPFIHVGDFNFVGYKQQVETLRIGDIENESEYGNDFLPDWDSSPLIDLFPRHTHKRMGYTWRKDWSSYNPGKLDYVFYSDYLIEPGKYFIVNTLEMDDESLSEYGLQLEDTQEASDHLPIVFDISSIVSMGINNDRSINSNNYVLLNNYPNPFNPKTTINIKLDSYSKISLEIFDIQGHLIDKIFMGNLEKGLHQFDWDATKFSSGIYFIIMRYDSFLKTKKVILLK